MGNKPARDYTLPTETGSCSTTQKIVLLGPTKVGKTALVCQFTQNAFPEFHDPTVEDSFRKQIEMSGRALILDILDTAGEQEYAALQDQYMRTGDGVIMVYSVTDRQSFENCPDLYQKLLRARDVDSLPFVLVGNKSDSSERVVSLAEGEEMAKQNGWTFFETSAKDRIQVDEVFNEVSRRIISSQQRVSHK